MKIYVKDKYLRELYETGKSKKLRLPFNVIDKFFATVQKIEAAMDIYDLWADKGLRFEKLKGHENKYSMRLDGKYRLELEIEWENKPPTKGVFYLLTISNHYA